MATVDESSSATTSGRARILDPALEQGAQHSTGRVDGGTAFPPVGQARTGPNGVRFGSQPAAPE
jgi:hypothetical protein